MENLDNILKKHFTNSFRLGYCTVDGVSMPVRFQEMHQDILEWPVNEEDVWICSFPKTGTTWTQEMVWMMVNNMDFDEGKENLGHRSPFLEVSALFDYRKLMSENEQFQPPPFLQDSLEFVRNQKSPICIKTHLPMNLLPKEIQNNLKKPKIIYVARNPKDTCISYYHHSKLMEGYTGTFEDFAELFLNGKVNFAPYWNHVLPFWRKRFEPNILFLQYEEMKENLEEVLRKVAQFLNRSLSNAQIATLAHHLSFESMRKNPAVNYELVMDFNKKHNLTQSDEGCFMRSGKVGDYKGKMSAEMERRFDKWTTENLKSTSFTFRI